MPSTTARVVALLLLALALRLVAAGWWHARLPVEEFGFGDSESYWVLGQRIARGQSYEYLSPDRRVFRTPGYPVLLAGLFQITGDGREAIWWARVQGALLGTLAVGGVFWLSRLLLDEKAASWAALVAACYPGGIALSAFVLSEAVFCPLLVVNLAVWVMAWQAREPRRFLMLGLLAGAAAGLTTLVRPSWLMFVPFAGVVGLALPGDRVRQLRLSLLILVGLAVTMTPWWIRNARVTGRFVPTTLQVGASLYDGLNPRADGGSDMWFVEEMQARERAQPSGNPTDVLEYRLDQRMRGAAITWAADNPGQALRLAGVKLVRMWNVWPNEPGFSTWPVRLVFVLTFLPIIALAIFGAARTWRLGFPYVMCWLLAVYLTLLHVVFVSSLRYREPAMLPLIVLAVSAVASVSGRAATDRNAK